MCFILILFLLLGPWKLFCDCVCQRIQDLAHKPFTSLFSVYGKIRRNISISVKILFLRILPVNDSGSHSFEQLHSFGGVENKKELLCISVLFFSSICSFKCKTTHENQICIMFECNTHVNI